MQELQEKQSEPIAIVGMGCRLPGGVTSPADLWRLVSEERDAIGPFPDDRGWELDADGGRPGSFVKCGGFLDGVAEFDAEFFNMSPRAAMATDPQQRLLLETAWETFEQAMIDPQTLRGSRTGVFVGLVDNDYGPRLDEASKEVEGHLLTGTLTSVASGRIAYVYGLEGPAVTIDTACSSSLVALHSASQSLRSGECDLALAGGAAVMSGPGLFVDFGRQRGLAADGRCKAFADTADGTNWGEGVGLVLLERLSDARRNGHRILAVIRGSAINQDGASTGLSAPNGTAQQRVILQALANAGLSGSEVDLVEGHGTGTALGDPVEAHALLATYGRRRPADRPLWLGSLKSNIGHCAAAAGVAGVIKTVLGLRLGFMPKSLHSDKPSSKIDWDGGAVRLLSSSRPWPETGGPRRAAVSAFGISGTNAHVILEAPPTEEGAPDPVAPPAAVPWLLSAKSPRALREQAKRLRSFVEADGRLGIADIGASSATTRTALKERAVVVGGNREQLLEGLRGLSAGRLPTQVVRGTANVDGKTVFIFPGQGAQWPGMAVHLLDSLPVFRDRFHICADALAPWVDWSPVDVLREGAESPLWKRTDVVQPLLWAVMVALAEVWRAHGVQPDAVIGHSQGELAAACVAGALSVADAAQVVVARSRALMPLSGTGGMVVVPAPESEVRARIAACGDRLSLAAVNGPRSVVVSGEAQALDDLVAAYAGEQTTARRVDVDYASHSRHVERIREELLGSLAGITPQAAQIPLLSPVDCRWIEVGQTRTDAEYWYTNLRQPVLFSPAVRVLADAGYQVFIEMSPHPVLTAGVTETLEDHSGRAAESSVVIGSLRRDQGGLERMITSLAEAYVRGVGVRWERLFEGTGAARVELPTYAFQHRRYWMEAPRRGAAGDETASDGLWASVEAGDAEAIASVLQLDPDDAAAALPALTAWRRRVEGHSAADNWRLREAWTPLTASPPSGRPGRWLAVVPAAGAEHPRVTAVLGALGADVLRWDVHQVDRADMANRLADAAEGDGGLAGVVSLLALDDSIAAGDIQAALAPTVALVQAWGESGTAAPLWCLTSGAVSTGPEDAAVRPEQAACVGFGRVAALEYPERWGGLVDLPGTVDESVAASLAAVLAGPEDQVAVRASGAFGRRLVHAPSRGAAPQPWRARGTVLITGGTGGIGAHLGRWVVSRGAEHVVLASRRGHDAPGAAELAARLRQDGAEITLAACDVGDREALAAVLAGIPADRPLTAVFHAAGLLTEDGPIESLTPNQMRSHLAAKAISAWHLHDLTGHLALDAFVLFASGASSWGTGGQAGYAAANAFLESLAHYRRAQGLAATAVSWGAWGGTGMADDSATREQLKRHGMLPMHPKMAVATLQRILEDGDTAATVAAIDWTRFAPSFTTGRPSLLFSDIPEFRAALTEVDERHAAESPWPERFAELSAADLRWTLLGILRTEAARILGHAHSDAIDNDMAFRDMGFDSVSAVDLRDRLRAASGLALPATLVFNHPTPTLLVENLLDRLAGAETPPAASTGTTGDEDPIVIAGMACRFPGGADSPEQLWDLLVAERSTEPSFPQDRGWDLDRLTHVTRGGGFLADVAGFDAGFFAIAPREALTMDPQQRLVLEVAWEALEHTGIDPLTLTGSRTGVFIGAGGQDYHQLAKLAIDQDIDGHALTGTATSVLSGRLSYTLGLEGPAFTIDTACSSSLTALHLAAQAMRQGECDRALVGGVTIMTTPNLITDFAKYGALAVDGRCKAFSDDADGIGCAEGIGMVVLERLSAARRDGHPVLAVVRGSAVNQDGASNGLSAPNGMAQQRVIRQALANAGLSGDDVDVVEAHGTGTALGDPIEAEAVLATYGKGRPADRPLWFGSVKSNIGHTQAAAGMAGLIKLVLAMRNGLLPRTLNVDTPSSRVDWGSGGVRLLTQAHAWPETGRLRRAGISSFGISGTNAHLIVEDAPFEEGCSAAVDEMAPKAVPWLVSARTEAALRGHADRLASHAASAPGIDITDAAWSLTRRSDFKERAVVVGRDQAEIAAGLRALADGGFADGMVRGTANIDGKTVFVFPGHGSQWAGMATGLLDASPVFARRIAECGHALAACVDWTLTDVVRAAPDAPEWQREDVVQPVLWAVMVSLAEVWRSHGVEPDAVVGHSLGEVAAACVAGALSLEDAARVVVARSSAVMGLSGAMAVVPRPVAEVEERVAARGHRVSVAAVNSPRSVVLTGERPDIDEVVADYAADGVELRRVKIHYAAHSERIEAVRDGMVDALAPLAPRAAEVPMVSTVEADWADTTRMDAGYWYANLRQPVRFESAVGRLAENGCRVFIEISPHPILLASIQETLEAADGCDGPTALVGSLRRGDGGPDRMTTSLAEAHVRGVPVRWQPLFGDRGRSLVQLPTYPFQRRRYWITPEPDGNRAVVHLAEETSAPAPAPAGRRGLDLVNGAGPAERRVRLQEVITRLVAHGLGADPGELDVHEELPRLGLDSLLTVQVRAMLAAELGITLPLVAFQEASSIAELGERILPMLGTAVESSAASGADPWKAEFTADRDGRYEPFDLTDLQQAYVVGRTDALLLGRISAYFSVEVDLQGVDLDALNDAFQATVRRHDMLRALITPDGRQRVLRDVPRYEFHTVDLEQCDESERAARLDEISREMRTQMLDVTAWPLFDIRLTKLRPGRVRLHIGFELLIADGWSTAVWFHDWAAYYHGATERLASLNVTYRDCLTAIRGQEGSPETLRALEYWRARAATLPPAPPLPLAKDPATVCKPDFTRRAGRLDVDEWGRFQEYAAAVGVSPSAALCAVYAEVIAAWTGTCRFTLTVVAYNRPPVHPDITSVVGSFTTTVLLEIDSTPTDRFAVRAERIQKQLWSDLDHLDVTGVQVLREINRGRPHAERAIMPVVFASTVNFAGQKNEAVASGAMRQLMSMADSGEVVSSALRTPQVWLDHQLIEEDGTLAFNWDCVDELFPEGMLDAMFKAYADELHGLCADENAWHRPAPLLVQAADLEARDAANATAGPAPQGLLHEDFLRHAQEHPDRPAVIAPDRTLTYGQLDRLSNGFGRLLQDHGAGSGSFVGVVAEKGWEQVVACLAVLKTGAAYVPIDASVPTERLRQLTSSAGISVALTQSRCETAVDWPDGTKVFAVDGSAAQQYGEEPLIVETAPDELAYVIYTSGSTGVPKGVMIEHRSALNTVRDVNERFAVGPDDRILGLSALNFDLSVYDVFGTLSAGGALVLPEPAAHREPSRWAALAVEHRVTLWNSVPKLMEMFVEHVVPQSGFPFRVVMLSGDWIPVTLPERIRQAAPGAEVWSLGGATEAAIWSIWYPIGEVDPRWASIPYGKPMRNQRFHILNEAMQPCPTWVEGNLYIAGSGLARGYLNDAAKTRASFIRHPVTGERLYATGDLGRYLPDGNIEFLGRADLQVKIQGHRIELCEVEAALLRCRGVREAVAVVAGDRHSSQRLVAYAVLDDGHEDPMQALRRQLPGYLVPQQIVALDTLPLSANGKVDRAALPARGTVDSGAATVLTQPRDRLEEELVGIWAQFFEEPPFGTNTSFFDLGGDSLLAVRMMARIQALTGRSLPVSTLFSRPTIELLAEALRDAGTATRRDALVPVQVGGELPPLFFAHPVGGDVLCYAELARLLGDQQPFYALQVPDVDPLPATVPEMAEHYTDAIRTAAPHGPYRLGGWSMGGVLALEIAQQLAKAGEEVEIVAVIDLVEPPGPADLPIDEPTALAWFARDLAGLVGVEWAPGPELFRPTEDRTALEILHSELCRASVLPPSIDVATLGRIISRFTRNAGALREHAPQAYPGRVRFFRGRDGAVPDETIHAWTRLFAGDAAVIDVPGDHYTMMRRPHLDVLAAELKTVLSQIR
ncbi:type I polyketide synthase [Streptomyces sp. NPDC006476]|uniref:type I polyketide synthase n=1 Tax=Streptomyces sp. NPDC006476 TaxID=3157175 RepID=UPI0033A49E03